MKNSLYKKGVVFGIIVLFISIAFLPMTSAEISIYENFVSDIDSRESSNFGLVKKTIKIISSDGIDEYTVMLTNQQTNDLDTLFDDLKIDLGGCETHEETKEVYNDAVVSLYEIGVLPDDTSIEEVQSLVTEFEETENHYSKPSLSGDSIYNTNCYISGETTKTSVDHAWYGWFFSIWLNYLLSFTGRWYAVLMSFGGEFWDGGHAQGWVHTDGDNGIQNIEGNLWGQLRRHGEGGSDPDFYYIGAVRFFGVYVWDNPAQYMGRADRVAIGEEQTINLIKPIDVTMPRSRAYSNMLLLRLIEQFPLIQRLLKL